LHDFSRLNWITDFGNSLGEALFQKHPNWEYEDETRIIFPGVAGNYLRFDPAALTGLIFGWRADVAVVDVIKGLLAGRSQAGHPPINLYKVVPLKSKSAFLLRKLAGR
jgi:hypothetical protein